MLLLVFAFHIVGYHVVIWSMQSQAKHRLFLRFDTHRYAESELVILTFSLGLPYPVESGTHRRVDSQFEYKNESYRLVEQRLENDTLFMVCIKDCEASLIAGKFLDYINLSHDVPGSKQAMSFLGKLNKDFNTQEISLINSNDGTECCRCLVTPEHVHSSRPIPVESPPPDLLS